MSRPGGRSRAQREEQPDLAALGERVSAARAGVEARGETFYPGAEPGAPGRVPAEGALGRLGGAGLPGLARPRGAPLHAGADHLLQLRVGVRAAGLRRPRHPAGAQVRGQPGAPGLAGPQLRQGPGDDQPGHRPRPHPLPAAAGRRRGEGRWERISWDEALDAIAARIRAAIAERRQNEIMVHIGRPGEDGYTERVLASWGVDGHNSHTNVCSSGGRAGYQFWMGIDRPSPDHANAKVIYLISSHLEAGHYFNPHAQRITEARARGAKVIVLDTRLSNTATHADHWLSPQPGSEAAINLAVARHLISTGRYDPSSSAAGGTGQEYLPACRPDLPVTFEAFEPVLAGLYAEFTFDFAAAESGIDAAVIAEVADVVAGAGTRVLGALLAVGRGGQPGRLAGIADAVPDLRAARRGRHRGRHVPERLEQVRPAADPHPAPPRRVAGPVLAAGVPAGAERDVLPAAALPQGRPRPARHLLHPRLQPGVDQPGRAVLDGGAHRRGEGRLLRRAHPDLERVGLLRRLRAADGARSERHDTHSYEQYDGQWIGFRQPVLRAARERLGEQVTDTRQVNPGEVWEENEWWIELSWRIDPDGSLGIRQYHESRAHPGEKLTVDEYYGWMFENSVPGLPERAAAEGLTPLECMRRYGAFEIASGPGRRCTSARSPPRELRRRRGHRGRPGLHSAPPPGGPNIVPMGAPGPDGEGRRPAGVMIDGVVRRGFPTPSGRLEF